MSESFLPHLPDLPEWVIPHDAIDWIVYSNTAISALLSAMAVTFQGLVEYPDGEVLNPHFPSIALEIKNK